MGKRKTYILIVYCLLSIVYCSAQVPYSELVGSTGHDTTVGGMHLSYSVGEPMVQTWSSGAVTITQGFQQPQGQLVAFASTSDSVICAGDSAVLTVIASGDSPPFTYNWSPAGSLSCTNCSNPVATPTITTTYSVIVSKLPNTPDTAYVTVVVDSLPTISITYTDDSICEGGSVVLIANGGLTYVWSTGATSGSITEAPSSTTIYTVTGKDSSGCGNTDNLMVTVISQPTVNAGPDKAVCANNSAITLSGSSSTGSGIWTGGDGTFSPDNITLNATYNPGGADIASGSITISLASTNNGPCVAAGDAMVLTINQTPTVTVTSFTTTICEGDSTTLNAIASGGSGAYNYNWIPATGLSNSTISNPVSTTTTTITYSIVVTDASLGCTDTATTTVTVNPTPIVTISPNNPIICSGQSATLNAGGASSYVWSPSGGLSCTSCSNPVASPPVTMSYTVTGTSLGCAGTKTVTVTVNASPTASVSATSNVICAGQNTTLSALGGTTYSWWNNSSTTSSITVSPATTTIYTVTATNGFGCTDTAGAIIVVNALPAVTASASPNNICTGGSSTLTASGSAINYAWSSGGTASSEIVSPASTGVTTYTVTGTDGNSCTNTATVSVTVNSPPIASINGNTTICAGNNATLTASPNSGVTYLWNTSATSMSIFDNPATTTNYSVVVTSISTGCSDTAYATVNVNPTPTVTVTNPQTICSGTNITLTANTNGTSYVWNPGGQTTTSVTVNPTSLATYTFTTSIGSCSTTATTSVSVNPTPNVTLSGGNTTLCLGQTTTLTATGGGTYLWSDGTPTPFNIITPSSTGTVTYSVTVTIGSCQVDTSISIMVNPSPTASISSPTNASCFNICNGDATVAATGGTSPYTYLWSDPFGQTTLSATGLCAGNYTSTVTDQSGCSQTNTVLITQPAAFSTTVSATSACNSTSNGTASVSVTGGVTPYSYLWNPSSQTTSAATNLSAGNYSVVITDANGCTGSATATVASSTVTASISGNTTICSGQQTSLVASGGSSYLWSNNATTSIITTPPLTSNTNYTVTVSDSSGCSDTATITVNIIVAPVASATVTPSSTVCSGTPVTLSASGGTTYSWSNGTQTTTGAVVTITPTVTTTYTLVVANGSCTDTLIDSVVVNSVTAQVNGTVAVCIGDMITLGSSGGNSYSWNGPNSFSSALQNPSIANATAANSGTYTVTVTDANGCADTATINVSVTAPPVPGISATASSVCSGTNDTLVATGGITGYLWSTGQTSSSIIVQPVNTGATPISVTYTVTAFNGVCSSDTTITLIVLPLPVITVSATPQTICVGDSATLTPSGGIAYAWSTGVTTFGAQDLVVSPTASTSYWVAGVAPNGCVNFSTTSVDISAISVDAGSDQTICFGFTTQLDATVSGNVISYLWSPASSLNDISVFNPTANPDSSTLYFVEVQNSDLCYAKDSVAVIIVRNVDCLVNCDKIYNGITPNGDGDNEEWWIDGIISFPENNVNIFNRWGTNVWGKTGYDNKKVVWNGTNLQEQELPDGTYYYIIEIHTGDGTKTCSGWIEITR